jgi:hypothetical protein
MRGEITDLGEFQRIDSSQPVLTSVYFTNPTNGYAVGTGIYKNTTGILLGVNDIITNDIIKNTVIESNNFFIIIILNFE